MKEGRNETVDAPRNEEIPRARGQKSPRRWVRVVELSARFPPLAYPRVALVAVPASSARVFEVLRV